MIKKYRRFLLLPIIILLIIIFTNTYIKGISGQKIFSYTNDGYFRPVVSEGKYLYIEQDYPDYIRIDTETGEHKEITFDNRKCINVFSNPELCRVLGESDLEQQRTLFQYSDHPEEFYGIIQSPLWEADILFRQKDTFYILAKAPVYHLQVRERADMFRSIFKERLKVEQKEDRLVYHIPFPKSQFEFDIDKDDYFYFATASREGKMLNESFLRPDPSVFENITDISLSVSGKSVSVVLATRDYIYRYFSYDEGRSFDSFPQAIERKGKDGIKFSDNDNEFIIAEWSEEKLYLSCSDDLCVSFDDNMVINTGKKIKDVVLHPSFKYIAVLHGGQGKDLISVYQLKNEDLIFRTGNIMPQSLSYPVFINDSIFYSRQTADNQFEIIRKDLF